MNRNFSILQNHFGDYLSALQRVSSSLLDSGKFELKAKSIQLLGSSCISFFKVIIFYIFKLYLSNFVHSFQNKINCHIFALAEFFLMQCSLYYKCWAGLAWKFWATGSDPNSPGRGAWTTLTSKISLGWKILATNFANYSSGNILFQSVKFNKKNQKNGF